MKKKLTIFSCVIVALISAGLSVYFFFIRQEPVYIAVALPLSGDRIAEGEEMLRGISLCMDEVNQGGGIDGRKIRLRLFNDKGRAKGAAEAAFEITGDKDILLVLGHLTSEASIAAGRSYRKNGIPAITASATAGPVTSGNDWYFRAISDNASQGSFIAGYVSKSLRKESASIIFSGDSYGTTLAWHFEKTARALGLGIKKKWKFQPKISLVNNEIKRIAAELRALEDPGMIFIAIQGDQATKIISSLKIPGTDYSIIGPDSFTTESFLREFNKYPQERAKPGYFTDNIYAVSPFLKDIANEKAGEFRQKFIRKYKQEPTWISACYYDAAMVAAEAIRKTGIRGKKEIRRDRKEIREFLAGINTMEDAVKGVTGYIYFDKKGDTRAPFLTVAIYRNQELFPAYSQYQPSRTIGDDALKKSLNGEIIMIEERIMNKTDVVYTGIDVSEISNLNLKRSSFTADFYVWFQYEGEFDAANVLFVNAVKPVSLEYPIVNRKTGSITVQSYHVKADFRNDFDFHDYPFDDQRLRISFRHAGHTRDKLIYAPGTSESRGKITRLNPVTGWGIKDMQFYQDIITVSTVGDRDFADPQDLISYSRFNAEISIRRKGYDIVSRYFLPVLVIALALYMAYFIPYEQYIARVLAIMFSLAAISFYHRKLLSDIETGYWSIAEYAIFTVYGLLSMCVVISIVIFSLSRGKRVDKIKQLNRTGKILHFVIVLAAGVGIWLKVEG